MRQSESGLDCLICEGRNLALTVLYAKPESGLDCLICAEFARERRGARPEEVAGLGGLGAKMERLKMFKGELPESQGQNLALPVLCVPNEYSQGQNLALTVLYVPKYGLDCLICDESGLDCPESGLDCLICALTFLYVP